MTGTWIERGFLAAAGLCFLFGTGVTVVDVALRAVAGTNVPGAIELTSLSIGLGALLSMPVCYAKRAHVTAKLLSEVSPNRFAWPLGMVGTAASILFAAMLAWIMAHNALDKWGSPETTADLGVPIPYAVGLIAVVLLSCAAAALIGFRAALWVGRARR
ncbi:TRAP transporter small permease [Rhodovulum sp. FJ3]|uniref:TRAP transporter small permease n=1 Tax=Rhodovulum sp. FJ3 TaxID=3079053 RepID=UPI00293DFA4B|nr:TRAP transporter small permease subunit [Rhodovulum sp. FJ3]MDV4168536.1 TRAP transporter small permease subunit [Rhodovulum sp. FJ3]